MRLAIVVFVSFLLSSIAFAHESNKPNTHRNHLLLAGSPPGLQKKGFSGIPYSGKVPPGWNEGLKKGWNKDKNWHWNNKTKLWENNNWRWDTNKHSWEKVGHGKMKKH